MKYKIIIGILISVLIVGCVTTAQVRAENRQKLLHLSVGESKQDVLHKMGTQTIETENGSVITNPYRTEMYKVGSNTFELLLYYTDLKKSDGAITDDELTPIVMKNGKVDGWGWSYWNNLINKYEIRVR